MLLFGLLLLTSALAGQRHGTQAESNLSSKFQFSSDKEQNGSSLKSHVEKRRSRLEIVHSGVQDPQHERIITVSTNGSIHSPRFPHTYPRNMVLVWKLVAVEENVWIQLTFDERFGLEDPEDDICKYDFVEVEEPSDGTILGRWCGSGAVPGKQISKGNQIRIRFVSDEYFPSEPGFCIHYNIVMPQFTEAVSPSELPPSALPLDLLDNAVTAFTTLEDLFRYLEPDRWQLDLEDLYRPTWQLLGKAFVFGRKSRVVDLNLLKEEVLQLRPKVGVRGLHKSLTDVALEHHEECDCMCRGSTGG
ncbi:platelet-derived growth factor C isoform X3 [Tamandua tetradactyla]|uniref:platelet-derived growth factor C isoform X3 n=1 Tax=Tamandua tetradactyla TaxID=48850 RepID=UPI0040545039